MITRIENYDLTDNNTFAMRVKCSVFVEYDDPADIPQIISEYDGTRVMHIGRGSNILFTRDFYGAVLHSLIKGREVTDGQDGTVTVRAGAGEVMDELVEWACTQGLRGLENLSGIPGEAGSAAVQNVGAYGTEAGDHITAVHAWDTHTHAMVTLTAAECGFGYRQSVFKTSARGRYILHHVDFKLQRGSAAEALAVRAATLETRAAKLPDPKVCPSAGSFFKNPIVTPEQFRHICEVAAGQEVPHYPTADGIKIPAAWLIDQCGWKGKHMGPAAVWPLQPLVLTNPGFDATAEDIINLAREIVDSVVVKFGQRLYPEVEMV